MDERKLFETSLEACVLIEEHLDELVGNADSEILEKINTLKEKLEEEKKNLIEALRIETFGSFEISHKPKLDLIVNEFMGILRLCAKKLPPI